MQAVCPNCDTPITGPYCASCGQEQRNLNRYIWSLAGETLSDTLSLDSRAMRTLKLLAFSPGKLTSEYFAGRRARYVPPVRLYLVISFLFFFILPQLSSLDPDFPQAVITDDETELTEGLDSEIGGITLDNLTPEENQQLNDWLQAQVTKATGRYQSDPEGLIGDLMDLLSAVMFFLLPIFAIALKIMYLGSGRYYAEHLLLAVHNHCFLFLALLLANIVEISGQFALATATDVVETLIQFWIPIYMYLSLKNVMGEGHALTTIKFILLGLTYLVLATIGFIAALILGVLTL